MAITALLLLNGVLVHGEDPAKERHIVLVVWDGMRPDYVTQETSPTLYKLASEGTFFDHHHSVYITSTEVNGTAMATGCYPNRSGVMGNLEYRPDLNLTKPVNTENMGYMRIADALTEGKYLGVPTMAETIQAAGFPTVVAGAKPVAALQDRSLSRIGDAARSSVLLYAGVTQPPAVQQDIVATLGPFPPAPELVLVSNTAQNEWTTRALTEVLWKNGVPKLTVLWLSEPDYMQHQLGPGSFAALAGVKTSDTNLARMLAALDAKGLRDKTDVFVVSDHGFSTVNRILDLVTLMNKAGFHATRYFRETPRPGEVLAIALGGSTFLYVVDHDPAMIQKVVDFLQTSDFAGPIFTKNALPGTFALEAGRIDTANAPDIVFSYRWTAKESRFGAPGEFMSEASKGRTPGFGTHASLSRFDFHNTLVAAGPDIRAGWKDEYPTANVDLAPTFLHLLGISQQVPMDGRVMTEALANEEFKAPPQETKMLNAERQIGGRLWQQYLKYTVFGDRTYLDEGNFGNGPTD